MTPPGAMENREPSPPEGHGPALAWHHPLWWKDGFRPAITYILTILVVFLTVKEQGIGWMTMYGWWLFLAGISLLSVPWFRGRPFAAGAAWFRNGGVWVNTYELVSIRVVAYYGFYSLKLKDADGRRISIGFGTIRQNRPLWNLVYDGIVHSAHTGRLVLDGLTRSMLGLPVLHTDPEGKAPEGMAAKPPLRSTVWSLLPLLSFGLLTPLVVGHAARRMRCKRLAWGAVAYTLPVPVFLVAAALVPSSDAALDWETAWLVSGIIIAWMPGGLHAYRLRWRLFARPREETAREQILARRAASDVVSSDQ
jgi:hypothetical protein